MYKTLNNCFLGSLIFLLLSTQAFAKEKSLSLAFFPYVNPSKIIQHNRGLKHYLEQKLNHPVSIITAKNSKDYLKKVKKSTYDLLFAAPHIGHYAEVKSDYQRVAVTKNKIQGFYLVKKDSTITGLKDLKDKTISMASAVTILHQIAIEDLKKTGLIDGKNITVKETKNHLNAIFTLIKGKSDAALTGVLLWKKLPAKYKKQLKLLGRSTQVPGFTLMAHKRVDPTLVKKAHESLLKFHQSKEGQAYLFKGFRAITEQDMKQLDPYIKVFN